MIGIRKLLALPALGALATEALGQEDFGWKHTFRVVALPAAFAFNDFHATYAGTGGTVAWPPL